MSGVGYLLAGFALLWSVGVLWLDVCEGWGSYRQIVALGYPSTSGRVTGSHVWRGPSGGGVQIFRPDIKYNYEVAGKRYAGNRYCYGPALLSDLATASRIVAENRVGASVTVYYDPRNSADSLLYRGVTGADLLVGLFLLPFNAAILGVWWIFAEFLRLRRKRIAGGAKIFDDGFEIRVRPTAVSPLVAGLATTCLLGFVAHFPINLVFGVSPPLRIMVVVWIAVFAAGLLVFLAQTIRLASGVCDMVIDTTQRTIRLPRTVGRKQYVTIAVESITGLDLETIVRPAPRSNTSIRYAPAFHFTTSDGQKRKELLVEWQDNIRAGELVGWISEQLKLLGWSPR
jgi:hypothetical protein